MYDAKITIRCSGNGYTVSVRDPELSKKNSKGTEYVDPNIEYVFKTSDETAKFVAKALQHIQPAQTYETAFQKALNEGMDK
jgi:hypothetical protein